MITTRPPTRWHGLTFFLIFLVSLLLAIIPAFVLVSPGTLAAADKPPGERLVTLDLKGADIRDVLRVLSEMGNINVVTDTSVRGDITLTLRDIPVREAIDLVARTNGYATRTVDSTILVAVPQRFAGEFDKIRTKVFKLNYADPEAVRRALSLVVPQDKIQIDPRTNSVIVSGVDMQIEEAARIIARLDVGIPLIRIEARLEEIASDAARNLGIQWSFGKLNLIAPPVGGGIAGVAVDYDSLLRMLEDEGKAQTIARPNATTLDGMEARIFIGDRIPVVVESTQDGKVVAQPTFIEAGVKLTITPRVNDNGLITLHIIPEVSTITDVTTQGYPHIRSRQAETWATVKDGETVAIGGLFQSEEIRKILKVPLLGDIPIVGELFKQRTVDKKNTDMVIFVTCSIVRPGSP
ncbi:MAG TPA: hypothetical protein GXX51_10590 [Firmicutes bacterium]|nr:hypothetical protein [Bacillota bacterium]